MRVLGGVAYMRRYDAYTWKFGAYQFTNVAKANEYDAPAVDLLQNGVDEFGLILRNLLRNAPRIVSAF
jgi:hypothetical protein